MFFFWKSESGRKIASSHPELKSRSAAALSKTIPLGFHGDGGEYSHQDSIVVISWNSIIGSGAAADTRMIFTMIKKTDLLGNAETYNSLFKVFCWSMNSLMRGIFSPTDWEDRADLAESPGLPIAGCYSGAVVLARSDWQIYGDVSNSRNITQKLGCVISAEHRLVTLPCGTPMLRAQLGGGLLRKLLHLMLASLLCKARHRLYCCPPSLVSICEW